MSEEQTVSLLYLIGSFKLIAVSGKLFKTLPIITFEILGSWYLKLI